MVNLKTRLRRLGLLGLREVINKKSHSLVAFWNNIFSPTIRRPRRYNRPFRFFRLLIQHYMNQI
jgi:hypothetical protein